MHREIAQLRQRIDQEIATLRHAKGCAAVALHEVITHHFDRLSICFEELSSQIGKQAAATLIIERMEQEEVG